MSDSRFVLFITHYQSDQIKNNDMGGARMGERRGAYEVLVGKLKERNNLEDLVLNGRIILK
jgi:hypothetical protein